jgi:prepilin-type processing-associated H-X9-DG protein/prepilin-type N-terminal cleavage/methylation domain-containing protein
MSVRRSITSRGRFGFTLVELLIVISIIAVLIALLLPSLASVRRQADRAKCLSQLRNVAMGANLHAVTHGGYYPLAGHLILPSSYRTPTPEALGDPGRLKYTYAREEFYNSTTLAPWQSAVAEQFGKKKQNQFQFNEQIGDEEIGSGHYLRYFLCPSHAQRAGDVPESMIYYGANLIWMIQQSYVVNEIAFGYDDRTGKLKGKASRIRKPGATVMVADGLQSGLRTFFWTTPTGSQMNWVTFTNRSLPSRVGTITLADALAGTKAGDPQNFDRVRHKGKINVAFFDGHAETLDISDKGLQSALLYAN